MAATAIIVNNLPEDKKGLFSRAPLWFGKRGKKLKPSSYAIVGKIFGLSKVNNPDAVCRTSYDQLQQEIGIARSTVATALQDLKDAELIEERCREKTGTAFRFVGEAGKRYDIIPTFLYTADIIVAGEKRRLTKAQVRILSHIMTESKRPKNNGAYEGSLSRLEKALNLSEKTVKKAIKVLLKARLIYRPAEDKGVNSHKLTRYHVNRELFEYEKYRKKTTKRTETATSFIPKAVVDVNAKADREAYYAHQKAIIEERAERYLIKAYQTAPKLKSIDQEIKKLQLPLAKAELYDAVTYPVLKGKVERLKEERRVLMQRFNISEEKLNPEYYALCKHCKDSGKRSDGTGCTCYLRKEEL